MKWALTMVERVLIRNKKIRRPLNIKYSREVDFGFLFSMHIYSLQQI